MLARVREFLDLVKFSHSLFALPFALCGAWLAAEGIPSWQKLLGIVGAMVTARSAAMGMNRIADREIDAKNPRTRDRALPAGRVSALSASVFVAIHSLLFLGFSWFLGEVCFWIAPFVLALLFLYSWAKRWTAATHLVLGLCLGLSPMGAWLAVRGGFEGDLWIPLSLGGAVLLWVAGFDLIYACQDVEFDRSNGLRSVPARYGVAAALAVSAICHAGVIALLAAVGVRADLGLAYWAGFGLASILLVAEHGLVTPRDLSRVNLAFFTFNGWISVGLFGATALDFVIRGRVA